MNGAASCNGGRRILVLLLALGQTACLSSFRVEFEGLRYQERFRLDREPVSTDPAPRLHHHARADWPAQTIVPSLPGHTLEHLARSECLWTAFDPVSGRGDVLQLNWEAVLSTRFPDQGIGPVEIAMCRFTDPHTGGDIAVERSGLRIGSFNAALNSDGSIAISERAQAPSGQPVAAFETYRDGDVVRIRALESDRIGFNGAHLTALSTALGATDEAGACQHGAVTADMQGLPGPALDRPVVLAPGVQGLQCPGHPAGVLTLCAERCRWQPQADAQLLLGAAAAFAPVRELRPIPEIKVVVERRSLRRRMTLRDGHYGWQTPRVATAGDVRWRENFMPSLRVESVRLLARAANGTPLPVPAGATELCIRSDEGAANCRLQCPASAGQLGQFELLQGCFSPFAQQTVIPTLTPTYELTHLEAEALQQPLHWSVALGADALPAGAELLIEFTIANYGRQAAGLLAEPAALDFGSLRIGNSRSGLAELRNAGGAPLLIESVELVAGAGATAGGYAVSLRSPPRAVPLPIDVLDEDGSSARLLWPQADSALLQDLVLFEGEGGAGAHWSMRRQPAPGTATHGLYGQIYNRERGHWWHAAHSPDPTLAAEQAHVQRFPTSRADPHLLIGRPIFRQTHAALSLPHRLEPGDHVELLLSAQPASPGWHQAQIKARARTLLAPVEWVEASLAVGVNGSVGGDLSVLPSQRRFRPAEGPGWRLRNLLLLNNGDAPADRGPLQIVGDFADHYRLAATTPSNRRIDPGDAELITIEYLPRPCQAPQFAWRLGLPHRAELLLPVVDGDVLSVPLLQADATHCTP